MEVESHPAYKPGDVLLGKYRVERVVGAGGMGVVLAAEHIELGERVAIKLLRPAALLNKVGVARFMREARAAARIRSEHAVRVQDVGRLPDGMPYLVMEYLEGTDVSRRIKDAGPLPVAEAAELTLQACVALAVAHARGIVHRDVKPANLFVARRADGSPTVKLIDFGISKVKVAEEEGVPDSNMTHSQSLIGSPHYMAPEQMRSARDVDARADIWALGATLHKMVTGKTPFEGDTVLAIFETMLGGYAGLRATHPELPEALETLIARCLALEPAARYQDVAELAQALAPFAPERTRHLVQLAAGTLAAPVDSASSLPDFAPGPASSGSIEPLETVTARSETLTVPSAPAAGEQTGGGTQAAWGAAPVPSRRFGWPIGVVAGLAAAAAAVWFLGSTTRGTHAHDAGSALSNDPAPLASAEDHAPAAPPPPSLEHSAVPTATAAVSASANPKASNPQPIPRPPTAKPGPTPKPKNGDLWSDAF